MGADVVVVGGGIAGMAAADRLRRAGADVILLEKQKRLGGIVETTVEDGFVVEGGPDSFVTNKGSVLDLAEGLELADEVIAANPGSQGSYVWWDGRLHPLPGGLLLMVPSRFGPFLRSSLLTPRGKLAALKDLTLPRSANDVDESLGSFVRRRLGREILERIAEPLIAGIHAADPETMSLRASFPRFLEMEAEHRSLILAARRLEPVSVASKGRSYFSSFRHGMGQLVTALTSALERIDVRTGVAVKRVDPIRSGYSIVLADGSRLVASAVVLAVPAPIASQLLESLSREAAATTSEIGQVSNLAVTLAYQTEQLPNLTGSGFVVPSSQGYHLRGVSYLSKKWEGRVPGNEYTLLRGFFPAGRNHVSPVETARAELMEMIGVTADPVRSWVRRHSQGLHRYTLGHLDRVDVAERALHARPGIALAGAGFHGIGLNECISSGWAAADSILRSTLEVSTSPRDGFRASAQPG